MGGSGGGVNAWLAAFPRQALSQQVAGIGVMPPPPPLSCAPLAYNNTIMVHPGILAQSQMPYILTIYRRMEEVLRQYCLCRSGCNQRICVAFLLCGAIGQDLCTFLVCTTSTAGQIMPAVKISNPCLRPRKFRLHDKGGAAL